MPPDVPGLATIAPVEVECVSSAWFHGRLDAQNDELARYDVGDGWLLCSRGWNDGPHGWLQGVDSDGSFCLGVQRENATCYKVLEPQ